MSFSCSSLSSSNASRLRRSRSRLSTNPKIGAQTRESVLGNSGLASAKQASVRRSGRVQSARDRRSHEASFFMIVAPEDAGPLSGRRVRAGDRSWSYPFDTWVVWIAASASRRACAHSSQQTSTVFPPILTAMRACIEFAVTGGTCVFLHDRSSVSVCFDQERRPFWLDAALSEFFSDLVSRSGEDDQRRPANRWNSAGVRP